jgi:hypothetical protein
MKDELPFSNADCVAGIVAPLVTRDYLKGGRQDVHDLAFTFIAPLSSNDHNVFHDQTFSHYPRHTPGLGFLDG